MGKKTDVILTEVFFLFIRIFRDVPKLFINEVIIMQKNLLGRVMLFLLMALVFSGISAAFAQSDKEIKAIADPLVDKLTKAMETKNYKAYMDPWSPKAKGMMTKEKFDKACDVILAQVGTFKSKSFYNIVSKDGFLVIQWKAKYTKVTDDLYLQLVLQKEGGKYLVSGHWIKPQPLEK